MKKQITIEIRKYSEALPLIFEPEDITIHMTGEEMNLSGYGLKQSFDKKAVYEVPFFQLRAVEHYQQMKDAYKRGGMDAVKSYALEVMKKLHSGKYQFAGQ